MVFAINVILIALFIALPVSLDLMGNARKSSVESRIDYIGPSLILVPEGIRSSDLVVAQLKGSTYSSSIFDNIQSVLSPYLRNAEARLTVRLFIEGREMPVTGIDFQDVYSYPFARYSIGTDEVLLGSIASETLHTGKHDSLIIDSHTFTVSDIIPTAGGIYDVSLFLPLPVLQKLAKQEGRINEIRLFPRSVASYEELKLNLMEYSGGLNLIDIYRGDTAEKDIDSTLLGFQKALYAVAFILIALCIMISTYINLDGRKSEISTVYTLGATQAFIFQILIFRTIWITILGSFIGQLIALLVTVIQDHNVPLRFIWSTGSFLEVVLGAVLLGVFVTIPFAVYSLYKRDFLSYL
jgi:ABC-type antimicrobial peptide transport system permease subunit